MCENICKNKYACVREHICKNKYENICKNKYECMCQHICLETETSMQICAYTLHIHKCMHRIIDCKGINIYIHTYIHTSKYIQFTNHTYNKHTYVHAYIHAHIQIHTYLSCSSAKTFLSPFRTSISSRRHTTVCINSELCRFSSSISLL
jgi:hypothetical protein